MVADSKAAAEYIVDAKPDVYYELFVLFVIVCRLLFALNV